MVQREPGIIYVAFGYEYVLMALHSAKTAITSNKNIKCAIVTNSRISNIDQIKDVFCLVKEVEIGSECNRSIKVSVNSFSPFQKTLFLDCDTEVNGDLTPMLDCLDRFDIIAKLNSEPTSKNFSVSPRVPPYAFPMWNTGVIFFNAGVRTDRLFSEWSRIFKEMQLGRDQPAFARTIYENPDIRLLSVNCLWNTNRSDRRLFIGKRSELKSIIWHYSEPSQFLPAARAIYQLHSEIGHIYSKNNDRLSVEDVDRRYTSMLKPWYTLARLRQFFSVSKADKSLKSAKKTAVGS